jgi:hypothetical protein
MPAQAQSDRVAPFRPWWRDKTTDSRFTELAKADPDRLKAHGRQRVCRRTELVELATTLRVNLAHSAQWNRRVMIPRRKQTNTWISELLDAWESEGLVRQRIGQWSPDGGTMTEVEALPAMLEETRPPAVTEIAPELRTVLEMRDQNGKPAKFPGRAFRDFAPPVNRLNRLLRKTRVRINDEPMVAPQVRRIFNGDIEHGGRFYHDLQNLPKADRANLEINGEPVTEKDYSALHVYLLYMSEGIQYPLDRDPYTAACQDPSERDTMKAIALQVINDTSPEAAIAHLVARQHPDRIEAHERYRAELEDAHRNDTQPPQRPNCLPPGFAPLDPSIDVEALVRRFIATHDRVAHRFHEPGLALALQNMDARIAQSVILRCVDHGWPVLPVHDSFIAQSRHRDAIEGFMAEAYGEITGGFRCPIK